MLTPYQFSSNNPIENIDLDGLEGVSTTKGSAFIEGAKDGFLLTFTGHVSNGENAPKASVSNIPGKLGKALTLIKKIEDHIPDVPGLGMLKQVTLMESSANQALEVTYKAQQSGHSGWYATGLVGEKIFEAWAFKKIGGKVSSSRMGKLFSAPDPMTAEMSRPLTEPLPSLSRANEGVTFRAVSNVEVRNFISTEPGAQGPKAMSEIQNKINTNDWNVWTRPIYTTTYEGSTYILDGHNRLKVVSQGERPMNVSVQELSTQEAMKQFPEKMEDIKAGNFKTKISNND